MKGLAPSRFDAVEGALGESLRDSHSSAMFEAMFHGWLFDGWLFDG